MPDPENLERARRAVAGIGIDSSALAETLAEAHGDGYVTGTHAGLAVLPGKGEPVAPAFHDDIDWDSWEPGNAPASAELLGADGGRGLRGLLDEAGVAIRGISEFTMERLARELATGVAIGESPAAMRQRLTGVLGDRKRAELIARTEVARAQTAATLDVYSLNGMGGRKWLAARNAEPHCQAFHGKVWTLKDPTAPRLPLHPNCFPAGTLVAGPLVQATTVRPYEGPVITIRTAAGDELTGTPNHPVLTPHGWIPLGLLHEGQHVLRCSDVDSIGPAVDPDEHQLVARIEEVTAPGAVTLLPVPVAPAHFHGDGSDGDVHVELADGGFDSDVNARLAEKIGEAKLGWAGMAAVSLLPERPPAKVLIGASHTPDGVVSGGRQSQSLLGGRAGHPSVHGLRAVPDVHAASLERSAQNAPADAQLLRQRLHGLAGLVSESEVVEVRNHHVSQEVFNLSTAEGWYVANGLIVSNCRCSWLPVLASEMPAPISLLPRPKTLPHDAAGLTLEQFKAAKRALPKLKASVRARAIDVQNETRRGLELADIRQMAPPYARASKEARATGVYDWFWGLHPNEQARLRAFWFKGDRQTANADLIADRIRTTYGVDDFGEAIARWLEETRRYDAAGLLARGKLPNPSRYGGQSFDIDGMFGDGTFHVADIFDSDQRSALRSVAASTEAQADEFAARAFVKPTGGRRPPWEMSEADYVAEITELDGKVATIKPIRSDPDFGDEYSPEDDAVLRRFDELVPPDLEGAGAMTGPELHQAVIDLARKAGMA